MLTEGGAPGKVRALCLPSGFFFSEYDRVNHIHYRRRTAARTQR